MGKGSGGKMRKLFFITALILSVALIAPAMAETGKAGMAGAYMKFGLGARSLGMGGAFTGVAQGIDAVYYNPGGIGFRLEKEVGFTYHSLSLDRHLNSGAFLYPIRNDAILGVSWINSYVGDVPMIDSDRNVYDEFSNHNNSFGLTFSKALLEQVSFGANLRYLQATLDQLNAYTIGIDMGVLAKPIPHMAVGLSVSDLGTNFRWESQNYWSGDRGGTFDDKYPVRIRGGISGTFLDEQLLAAVDVMKVEKLDLKVYAGGEYFFVKKVTRLIEDEEAEDELREIIENKKLLGIRAGFSDGSVTFGGSIYYPVGTMSGGLDYAFMSGKEGEGSYHMFTARVMF